MSPRPSPRVGQATIGRCWLRPPSIGTTIAMLQMHRVSEMVGAGRILTKLARHGKTKEIREEKMVKPLREASQVVVYNPA